jgi:hypothetical protein
MNDSQQIQLQIIRQVATLLQGVAIPHWLFGGWAIDFQLGEVTRIHDDIEFLIWQRDAPQIASILVQNQYEPYSGGYLEEMSIFFKQAQKLEFDHLTQNAQGKVVVAGRWADWILPQRFFDAPPATLQDITCPVFSVEGLLAIKQGYADHPAGTPLREKDVMDIQRLRAFIRKRAGQTV